MCNVHFEVPTFGDLVRAIANLSFNESPTDGVCTRKRSWKLFSSDEIKTGMEQIYFDFLNEISVNIGVQEHWNMLENFIINAVDSVAPLVEVDQGLPRTIPATVKRKMNLKKDSK